MKPMKTLDSKISQMLFAAVYEMVYILEPEIHKDFQKCAFALLMKPFDIL